MIVTKLFESKKANLPDSTQKYVSPLPLQIYPIFYTHIVSKSKKLNQNSRYVFSSVQAKFQFTMNVEIFREKLKKKGRLEEKWVH